MKMCKRMDQCRGGTTFGYLKLTWQKEQLITTAYQNGHNIT